MTQYTMFQDGLYRRAADGMEWDKVPHDEAKALVAYLSKDEKPSLLKDVASFFAITGFIAGFVLFAAGLS